MATNSPVTSRVVSSPVTHVAQPDAVDLAVAERRRSTSLSQTKRIFSLANARSCMIFDARSSLRR